MIYSLHLPFYFLFCFEMNPISKEKWNTYRFCCFFFRSISKTPRENLEQLIGVMFLKKEMTANLEDFNLECAICYSYKLENKIPGTFQSDSFNIIYLQYNFLIEICVWVCVSRSNMWQFTMWTLLSLVVSCSMVTKQTRLKTFL
jgi:hypothetical protein